MSRERVKDRRDCFRCMNKYGYTRSDYEAHGNGRIWDFWIGARLRRWCHDGWVCCPSQFTDRYDYSEHGDIAVVGEPRPIWCPKT